MNHLGLLTSFLNQFGYIIITLFEMLEGMGIPIPGEAMLIAASIYAATNTHFSILFVIIFSSIGTIVGDNIGYWIGRRFGKKVLDKYKHFIRIDDDDIKKAEKFFKVHGNKTVFIGRFFAILRMFAPFLAGIYKMEYAEFFIFNALGGICWSALYGILGFKLGQNLPLLFKVLKDSSLASTIIIAVLIVIGVIIYLLRKNILKIPFR